MHCPSCQREHPEGMKFCPVTGVRLCSNNPANTSAEIHRSEESEKVEVRDSIGKKKRRGNPLVDAYTSAFRNYANFNGRTSRSGYWWFVLANSIVNILVCIASSVAESNELWNLYQLVVFLPAVAIAWRRLHDVGKSGLHYLWCFTVIGSFWVLYLLVQPSQVGENEFD